MSEETARKCEGVTSDFLDAKKARKRKRHVSESLQVSAFVDKNLRRKSGEGLTQNAAKALRVWIVANFFKEISGVLLPRIILEKC